MGYNPGGMTPAQLVAMAQAAAESGQQVSGVNLGNYGSTAGKTTSGGSIVSSEGVGAVTDLLSVLFGADNAQKLLDQRVKEYEGDLKFKYYQLNKESERYLAAARISAGSERDAANTAAETARQNAELAAQTALEIARMDDATKRDIAAGQLAQEFNRISAEEFGSPSAWIKQMRFMQGQGRPGERAGLTLQEPKLGGFAGGARAGATTTAGGQMPVASQALVGEAGVPELATALPGNQGTLITPLKGVTAPKNRLPNWVMPKARMGGGGVVTNDTYGQWAQESAKKAGFLTPTAWDIKRRNLGLPSMKTLYEPYAADVAGRLDVTSPMPGAAPVATLAPISQGLTRSQQIRQGRIAPLNSVTGGYTSEYVSPGGGGGRMSQGKGGPRGGGGGFAGWGTYTPGAKWVTGKGWVNPEAEAAAAAAAAAGGSAAPPAAPLTPEQVEVANLPMWARGKAGGQFGLWENWTGPRTIPELGLNEPITLPHEFDYRQWAQLTPAQKQMWLGTWEALGYYPDDALAILEGSAVTGSAGPMQTWG